MNLTKLSVAIVLLVVFDIACAYSAPRALYNPLNGRVEFQDVGGVRVVSLVSPTGQLSPQTLNYVPEVFRSGDAAQLSWFKLRLKTFEPSFSFSPGQAVKVGTPASEVTFRYSITPPGQSTDFPFIDIDQELVVVPEPATLAIAICGIAAVLSTRRRK
jgi:hypothetical protein